MNLWKKLGVFALIAVMSLSVIGDGLAKGGGFRSSGSSRSFSSRPSTSSPSKSWGSSSSKPTKSWGSSSSTKPVRKVETPKSLADRKAYETAKSNGKAFTTKSAAVTDFKAKAKSDPKLQASLEKSYPTKYATEPSTRPAHVPQSYNGSPVIFNNGGYGYNGPNGFNPLLTYMIVDSLSDAMLMSSMQNNGYRVGPPPVAQHTTVAAEDEGTVWGTIVKVFFTIVLIGIAVVVIIKVFT